MAETCLQIGIVGLPNVGKSTLFNVLTKMGIPAENFPFCTIEPNSVGNLPPLHLKPMHSVSLIISLIHGGGALPCSSKGVWRTST